MFEEYGMEGIDCKGKQWVRRELGKQMNDLTNQYFGNLIALFPIIASKKNHTEWLCKCKCGNLKIVDRALLNDGRTRSCGCIKSNIMKEQAKKISSIKIGNKYNSLTVLEYIGSKRKCNNELVSFYRCRCDCGNIVEVSSSSLISGNKKTCGLHNSFGELQICSILMNKNISFTHEYSFPDLLSENGHKLRFDFAIFNNNILLCLIEYQGSQHYIASNRQWNTQDNLLLVQSRDQQKRIYCQNNGYDLYEIKYTDNIEKNIQEILSIYGLN